MTLFEKSMQVLELPAVLEMLASHAASEGAKEAALKLRPSTEYYEVKSRLEETRAACAMHAVKGSPGFSGLKDVSGSLARADRGGSLGCRELLDIAAILRTARSAIAYAAGDKQGKTVLDGRFDSLYANKYFEEKVFGAILGDDELADTASAELSDIRRHMRLAGEKIRQSLQKIISSPTYAKVLQEPIITMRNDRYVVPVKAEHRSAVSGLVHDISASGATLFIEPMTAVQANNEIRELLAKEKREIERILAAFSAEASEMGDDIRMDYQILTGLDLIFAKAKLAFELRCAEPEISSDRRIVLRHARHPLLPKGTAVPIDLRLGGDFDTLVITGPNTGGKTVSIKTLGLLCIMAQCGLHIPADDGCCLPVLKNVLADIGDEQSIEQSLSTFSSHMTNIVRILDECGEDTLVIFDELGAGTDPVEGAALAMSIIEYTRRLGALVAATTHYAELKAYAASTEGVENGACEFDVETLRPTYRLLIGIPGKSNAFAISARLGLPEMIIEDARGRVGVSETALEDVLESVERARLQMERDRLEAAKRLAQIREDEKRYAELRAEAEKAREKAAVLAKREADAIVEDARRTAEAVFFDLDRMRKEAASGQDRQRANEARAEIRRSLNEANDRAQSAVGMKPKEPDAPTRPAVAGDTVQILSLGTPADVISVSPDGTLTLQAGIMKITAKQAEVRVLENRKAQRQAARSAPAAVRAPVEAVKPELDLRGMMTDEAIPVMEKYIDSASVAKLETVTIIHGKGTGQLRAAVQQALRGNREVKSFRLGRYGEGETGVTIVTLR
ncbi:MAG: endonuclease MutS2 [Oscillospiraceae bacterium]|nr:endonuclease MutS2 [Oscillospiraceae bacterium]